MDPILVVLVIVGVIALGIYSLVQDRKRKRLLRAFARSQGLAYHDGRETGWEHEYPAFKVLDRGNSRQSKLHLEGERDGRHVRCLDYRFTTGSGKNRKTHRRSLVVLGTGTPVIPLRIRPEHIFDKVGEFLGLDDLDFESSEFSRRFHVSSADRKWAYAVIHPRLMEYLLTLPGDVRVEFGFQELAVIRDGALTATRCHRDLKTATRVLELVPEDVLAELRGETP